MDADFLLNEAAGIVEGMEREAVLEQIGNLLEAYPDSPCLFMIVDALPPDCTTIETVTNCDIPIALWMAQGFMHMEMAAQFSVFLSPEEDDTEDEPEGLG